MKEKEVNYPVGKEKLILPKVDPEVEYVVGRKAELLQQFQSVKATLEIEGLTVTEKMEKLILANATGEISDEEFMKKVKEF